MPLGLHNRVIREEEAVRLQANGYHLNAGETRGPELVAHTELYARVQDLIQNDPDYIRNNPEELVTSLGEHNQIGVQLLGSSLAPSILDILKQKYTAEETGNLIGNMLFQAFTASDFLDADMGISDNELSKIKGSVFENLDQEAELALRKNIAKKIEASINSGDIETLVKFVNNMSVQTELSLFEQEISPALDYLIDKGYIERLNPSDLLEEAHSRDQEKLLPDDHVAFSKPIEPEEQSYQEERIEPEDVAAIIDDALKTGETRKITEINDTLKAAEADIIGEAGYLRAMENAISDHLVERYNHPPDGGEHSQFSLGKVDLIVGYFKHAGPKNLFQNSAVDLAYSISTGCSVSDEKINCMMFGEEQSDFNQYADLTTYKGNDINGELDHRFTAMHEMDKGVRPSAYQDGPAVLKISEESQNQHVPIPTKGLDPTF